METQQRPLTVNTAPDFFYEASFLMYSYFAYQEQKKPDSPPFAVQPLVTRPMNFSLSPHQWQEVFHDAQAFLAACRGGAEELLHDKKELRRLQKINKRGADNQEGFLFSALGSMVARQASGMTLPDFLRACLLQLREMSGDLDDFYPGNEEDQAQLERLSSPDLPMEEVFQLVNRCPVSDADRMTLLRLFQQPEGMFLQAQQVITALEDLVLRHYPLVQDRFLALALRYRTEGYQSSHFAWLRRTGTEISGIRPKEPLSLQISLLAYNRLNFRFSFDRRQPLMIMPGLLFDELDALQDQQKARNQLTEQQLKAIADPTRLAILRALSRGEYYAQQLAQALSLTPATLSHHMSALSGQLLVGIRAEGRRKYYHINREEVFALAEDLKKLAQNTKEENQ